MIGSQLALLFTIQGFVPLFHFEVASRPTADWMLCLKSSADRRMQSCDHSTSLIWSNLCTSVIICMIKPAMTMSGNGQLQWENNSWMKLSRVVIFLTWKLEGSGHDSIIFFLTNLFQSQTLCTFRIPLTWITVSRCTLARSGQAMLIWLESKDYEHAPTSSAERAKR